MAGKEVAVFGGSGFIGRYLVQRLARAGWRIRVPVRMPDSALFLKPLGDVGQIVPMAANIRDEASIARAVAGTNAVVNLVGILYERGRQSFEEVHHRGAARIARLAREAGAERLLHMSALGADPAVALGLCAQQGGGRGGGGGGLSRRHGLPAQRRVRAGGRFLQPLRRAGAVPAGPAADRRRPHTLSAGLCGRRGRGDGERAPRSATRGKTYELGGPRAYSFRELMEILLAEIRRRRLLVPVPFWIASLQGAVLGCLPNPPLTLDQVRLLKRDNVVSGTRPGLAELGVEPTALEVVIPTYLDRYRPGGWYSATRRE